MADPRWPACAIHKSILLLNDVLVSLKKIFYKSWLPYQDKATKITRNNILIISNIMK